MPELDVLRGVAVLGVLLLHGFSWQYSPRSFGKWGGAMIRLTQPGWVGINLFFVLSGFLITGILLDSKSRPDFYRRFYVRRALRILPAYYALLLLLLLLRSSSPAFVGLSFIYLANLTTLFGVACGYGPLWSLAVEEHFYIFWPAVVRNFTAKHLAWVSAAVVVLSRYDASDFVFSGMERRIGLVHLVCRGRIGGGSAAGDCLAQRDQPADGETPLRALGCRLSYCRCRGRAIRNNHPKSPAGGGIAVHLC